MSTRYDSIFLSLVVRQMSLLCKLKSEALRYRTQGPRFENRRQERVVRSTPTPVGMVGDKLCFGRCQHSLVCRVERFLGCLIVILDGMQLARLVRGTT